MTDDETGLLPIGPHDHPEPQTMVWTGLELRAIRAYAARCVAARQAADAQQADAELARLRAECADLRGGINVARSALALVQAECERLQVALTAQWVPMHERAPAPGAECVVLLRYALDKPPFASVDRWEEQREDPTGMGGPTIATGYGWNDNYDTDVIAWIAVPPHPPAEWDQRLPVPGAAT